MARHRRAFFAFTLAKRAVSKRDDLDEDDLRALGWA